MDLQKRKRSTNFSTKEEGVLISLVKKYVSIIECTKSDTDANRMKLKYWLQIEKEFNAEIGDVFRDHVVLKKKYDNIKKRSKKKYADEKCFFQGTGGGSPQKVVITDTDSDIKEILGSRLEGSSSEFDGDTLSSTSNEIIMFGGLDMDMENIEFIQIDENVESTPKSKKSKSESENCLKDVDTKMENLVGTSQKKNPLVAKDWGKYTPSMMKTPKSQPLVSITKTPMQTIESQKSSKLLGNKIAAWAASKNDLEEVKKTCFIEHELKMKHMEEMHQEQIKIMKTESSFKMQLLQEEHDKKMLK